MVVGNPCDDWNWMEELNRYMDVPKNHPGAFADLGFEHDAYDGGSNRVWTAEGTPAFHELRAEEQGVRDGERV